MNSCSQAVWPEEGWIRGDHPRTQCCPQEAAAAVLRRLWGFDGPAVRMKVDIKSFQPKVKASKSVKRFERYSHFKIPQFLPLYLCLRLKVYSRLSMAAQPPVTKFRDNTENCANQSCSTCSMSVGCYKSSPRKLQNYIFQQDDLDLWPMALTIKLARDVIKVNLCAKFCDCTSISSAVRVFTNWHADRQTDRQTDRHLYWQLRFYNIDRWQGEVKIMIIWQGLVTARHQILDSRSSLFMCACVCLDQNRALDLLIRV